jgi:hypothetical protein
MLATAELPAEARGAEHSAATTAGRLVLVVDDELPMQKMLGILLASNGLRTLQTTSGAEAIERAAECNPDVVGGRPRGPPDAQGVQAVCYVDAESGACGYVPAAPGMPRSLLKT